MAEETVEEVQERTATTFRGRVLFLDPQSWSQITCDDLREEQQSWGQLEQTKVGTRWTADQQKVIDHLNRPWEAPMETAMLYVQDLADAIAAKDPQSGLDYIEERWPDGHIEQGFRPHGAGSLRREGLWIGNLPDGRRSFTVEYCENQVVRTIGNDGNLISSFGYRFTEEDHRLAQEDGYDNAGAQMDAEVGDLYAAQRAAAGNSVQDWDVDFDRDAFVARHYQQEFGEAYDPRVATPEQRDRYEAIQAEVAQRNPAELMEDAVRQVRPVHNPHETQTLAQQIRTIEQEIIEQRASGAMPESKTPEQAAYDEALRQSSFPSGYGETADILADLHMVLSYGAKLTRCRTPDSRLVRGIDLDQPDQPFDQDAAVAEAQQWEHSSRTDQFQPWQKPILAKIRASSPEFGRQRGVAIARQMAEDWQAIKEQIAAAEGQDPVRRYVELRHADGSVERGLIKDRGDDVVRDGVWLSRNPDGSSRQRARYQDGELDGISIMNGLDGHVVERDVYCHGRLQEHRTYNRGQWQRITQYDADGVTINTISREQVEARRQRSQGRSRGVQYDGR